VREFQQESGDCGEKLGMVKGVDDELSNFGYQAEKLGKLKRSLNKDK
jgi:hypothetical protein